MVTVRFCAMGSQCEITLPDASVAPHAIAEVERIERRYSRYRHDSVLSDLNRRLGRSERIDLDDETADLIDHAFLAYRRSGGRFDITSGGLRSVWNEDTSRLPAPEALARALNRVGLEKLWWQRPHLQARVDGMEIDFGGLAKEYAADRAAEMCRAQGVTGGLVNLAGDIAIVGPDSDGAPWRIGITDPSGGEAALATLFLAQGGIATSGDYARPLVVDGRRFSHILDPRTGLPVDSFPSVTVVAESCLAAGVVATTALLMGEDAPAWLEAAGAPCLWIDRSGNIGGSIDLDPNDPSPTGQAPGVPARNCAIS